MCPYYTLWKVYILALGVPNMKLLYPRSKHTSIVLYAIILTLFALWIPTSRSTLLFTKSLLCVMLSAICRVWSIDPQFNQLTVYQVFKILHIVWTDNMASIWPNQFEPKFEEWASSVADKHSFNNKWIANPALYAVGVISKVTGTQHKVGVILLWYCCENKL